VVYGEIVFISYKSTVHSLLKGTAMRKPRRP